MNISAYIYDFLLYICNRLVAYMPSARIRKIFYRRVMRFDIAGNVSILSGIWFDSKRKLTIGENSVINQNCRIDNRGEIEISDNVSISPEVHILTADHDMEDPFFGGRQSKVMIESRVFIGSRATILPGVTIGEGAVVAACACVTKDVAPFSVVAGIPAVEIGKRNNKLTYEIIYGRHFF